MRKRGERRSKGGDQRSRGAASVDRLSDLGIPPDRAKRAVQLARVPAEQFEAALAEEGVARPGRVLSMAEKQEARPLAGT